MAIMKITILYFASLREAIGKGSDEISSDSSLTAKQAWDLSTDNKKMPDNTLIAINQEYVKGDTQLADGDELAFFPPVTGG